jgi:antitoxin component HigA of HigAB toxin-antitoxin module
MRKKTLDFLEAHQSAKPSTFVEDAKWRQENETWLKWSRAVALSIIDYMQENGLTRSDIANKLGVSPQYVSRILSGNTNFSLKSVAEIEQKLGISCMKAMMAR